MVDLWPALLVILCNLTFSTAFRPLYKHVTIDTKGDVGEPLFLTPLIEAGRIEEARTRAMVPPLSGHVESYSGFLTVNKQYQSNMFFWFFRAERNYEKAPVILWLQGGPGASSLYGLFYENGPFFIHKRRLHPRRYSWTKEHSVLYIDNPVGTGFSFTNDTRGYARNEEDVGRDLLAAIQQFFTLFPNLLNNDFYITGESYGGKYVPAAAYSIHMNAPNSTIQIPLKGIALGNGYSDPENMLAYGDYLYELGLIDNTTKHAFQDKENRIRQLVQQGEWKKASDGIIELINADPGQSSLFTESTGLTNYYNYIEMVDDDHLADDQLSTFVQDAKVRKAIHVGNVSWNDGTLVEEYLRIDLMKSVRPWIEELLSFYRVLIYNGQLDIICAYPLTENYLQKLNWPDKAAYDIAKRRVWKVSGIVAGYAKTAGNLTETLVRDAGHLVPRNTPAAAYRMIHNFTRNLPL